MSWGATIDPAVEIAIEHCRWARAYGLQAYEVGLSIERLDVRNWDDAVWAVAAAYDERFGNPCLRPAQDGPLSVRQSVPELVDNAA